MVEEQRCPKCGAPLRLEAGEPSCPACAMRGAFNVDEDDSRRSADPRLAFAHPPLSAGLGPGCEDTGPEAPPEQLRSAGDVRVGDPKTCPRCGSSFPAEGWQGLCPKCLPRVSLNVRAERGVQEAELAMAKGPASRLGEKGEPVRRFSDYELFEEVGRGGMGVVYRARQVSLNRPVALKMIASGELASPEFVQRFHLEAEAAAGLQHPNIVAIHEVGVHEGQHFYSMDYVEGQTLAERGLNNPLPPELAADYLKTIAEAVHYAHQRGILHRDLKPSNVLIDSLDQPHLTDFGLAKRLTADSELTLTGQVLGSPNYMPPEQALGQRHSATIACDVYSLGAILYFLLTGRPPFAAESLTQTLQQVLHSEPVPPQVQNPAVPQDLETICLKCLSKEPERRYDTAQELAEDLGRFLKDEPVQARPVGTAGKAWRWCRRNPKVAGFAGATVVLFLAVVIGSPVAAIRINGERKLAEQQRQAAQTALGETKKQQRLAAEQELLARRRFYAAQINLAGQAADSRDLARCVELLETQRPEAGKADLRTFEWYHLWGICHAWHHLTLEGHSFPIYALSFSPDDSTLASASYGEIRLWDVFSGSEKAALNCRPEMIYSALAFTPHGESLLSGSWDGIIRVWDTSTVHLRDIIPAHDSYIRSLSLSPNGQYLATGGEDGNFKLWETGSWNERTTIFAGPMPVSGLAFSPDGTTLASGVGWGGDDGVREITLWDVTHGLPSERLKLPGARTLAFSPDSKTLATSPWQSLELWDSTTGEPHGTLKGHQARVNAIAFVWKGNALASCAGDRTVRLWPLSHSNEDAKVESLLLGEHLAPVLCLAASADGKLLASGANDGSIKLWNVAQTPDEARAQAGSKFQLKPEAHGVGLCSLQFLPDGQTLVAVTAHGVVRRNILSGKDSQELSAVGECGALSLDGKLLATGGSDGTVTLWDYEQGHLLSSVTGHVSRVCATAFSPDGKKLASCAYNDHAIRAWDVSAGLKPLWTRKTEAVGVTALAFAPDGKTLAAALRHWPVSFLDPSTGATNGLYTVKARGFMEVHALTYSPDGKFLGMAGDEGTVRLWNVLTGMPHLELRGHSAAIRAIAYSPDGRTIGTGSDDSTVRLWDPVTGQERLTFKGFNPSAKSITFSSDGNTLAAGSTDGLVGFWQARHTAEPARRVAPRHLDSGSWALEEIPLVLKTLDHSKATLSYTVYNSLAWYCVTGPNETRSPDQALPLALKALELSKTNRLVLNTLGVVYYRLGRFTDALEVFEHNIQQDGSGPVTACDQLLLAMSYQRLGQTEKAQLAFSKATKWLDENPADKSQELKEFRAEAEGVLGRRSTASSANTRLVTSPKISRPGPGPKLPPSWPDAQKVN